MVSKKYKFYLAFENSNCVDYITEKFWDSLKHKLLPIVMGARVEDYEAVAPPNSFLHVDSFSGPEDTLFTISFWLQMQKKLLSKPMRSIFSFSYWSIYNCSFPIGRTRIYVFPLSAASLDAEN